MRIELKSLKLQYFKGIRDLTIDFSQETEIRGKNGLGKTTIFDAYSWLLWDKDSLSRSNFNIKTLEGGKPLPKVEHTVEGELLIDGEPLVLKKVYKEVYTKKRGQAHEEMTGHTTDYYMNSVPVKKKEYSERISGFIDQEEFMLLSNSRYFNEDLNDKKRRDILLGLIDTPSDLEIAKNHKELDLLLPYLDTHSLEEVLKILKSENREINKEIESIPLRIAELEKVKNTGSLEEEQAVEKELKEKIKVFSEIIAGNQTKNPDDEKTIENIKKKSRLIHTIDLKAQQNENKLKLEIGTLTSEIKELDRKIPKNTAKIKEQEKLVEGLRASWIKESQMDLSDDHCPYCQQELPPAMLEKMVQEFNIEKSNRLEAITTEAEKRQEETVELQQELEEAQEQVLVLQKELTEKGNEVESLKMETQKKKEELEFDIELLEKKLEEVPTSEKVEKAKKEQEELKNQLEQVQVKIAKIKASAGIEKRVLELKEELQKLGLKFTNNENIIYLAECLTKIKTEYIEQEIEDLFQQVSFKLFEQQVNGAINEVCEVLVDGVPYSDVNNAGKINAGVDVINTLSKAYQKEIPVFVDNAESVNKLLATQGQLVKLIVTEDKELEIKGV